MDIVLVDTSVWVNFFRDIKTDANAFLDANFTSIIIATCPVIVQEVLQGVVSDKDKTAVNVYFSNLKKLIAEPYSIAIEAANLYRDLRKKGATILKPNDCIIAAFAIKNDISLLEDDKDFKMIAKYSKLKLFDFH